MSGSVFSWRCVRFVHAVRALVLLSVLTLPARPQFAADRVLAYRDITGAVASLGLDGGRTEVEMEDVNGDGCPDLLSVGDHGSPFVNTQQHGVTLWLGDCAGGWTLVQVGNFGYGGLALGDVNWDGFMDVGFGVHHNYSGSDLGDQLLEVALGDGSGTSWTPWDDGLATSGETWGMFGTDFGDIDADGDLDVGSNSFGCCAGVHVYANHGDGTWSQSFGLLGVNSDMDFEFADFNADGHLDVMAANSSGKVYLGDGTGDFAPATGNLPNVYFGLSSGDLHGDGRDEIALIVSSKPQVWTLGGGGQWSSLTGNLAQIALTAQRTSLVDMNMDGRAELVTLGGGRLVVYRTDGAGAWWIEVSLSLPGEGTRPGRSLRTGRDLDHNGFPDISLIQAEKKDIINTINRHYVLAEESVPAAQRLHPVAPERGRVWRGGQVRFVQWNAALVGTDLGSVDVEFSAQGGAPPLVPLAMGSVNNGRAQVLVPAGVSSTDCALVYTLRTSDGTSRVRGPSFTTLP